MCVLEVIGDPSIFKLIRKVVALARVLPTFAFFLLILLYYESRKRELKGRLIYEDRYDERLKKLKMRNLHSSYTLGCATPTVIHT